MDNTEEERVGETVRMYLPAVGGQRTRKNNVFAPAQLVAGVSPARLPVSIERQPDGTITWKEWGPSFAVYPLQPGEF